MASVVEKWLASGEVRMEPVSGGLGLAFRAGGRVRAVLTLACDVGSGRVTGVYIVVNPEKLPD